MYENENFCVQDIFFMPLLYCLPDIKVSVKNKCCWCFILLACIYGGLRLWLTDYCHAKQDKLGGNQNTGFKREVRETFVYSLNAQSVLDRFSYWSVLNLSIHSTLLCFTFWKHNGYEMKQSYQYLTNEEDGFEVSFLLFFLIFRTSNYLL